MVPSSAPLRLVCSEWPADRCNPGLPASLYLATTSVWSPPTDGTMVHKVWAIIIAPLVAPPCRQGAWSHDALECPPRRPSGATLPRPRRYPAPGRPVLYKKKIGDKG